MADNQASEQLLVEVVVDDKATSGLNEVSKSIKEFGETSDKAMLDARRKTEAFNDSLTKFSRMGTRQIKTFDNAVTALLRKAPLAIAFDLGARVLGFENAFKFLNDTMDVTANSIQAVGRSIGNFLVPNLIEGNSQAKQFDQTLADIIDKADKRVLIPFGPSGDFDETNPLQIDLGGLERSSRAVEKVRQSVARSADDYDRLTNKIGQATAELLIFGKTGVSREEIDAELTLIGASFEAFGNKAMKSDAAHTQALITARRLNKEVAGLTIEADNQIKKITGFTLKFDQIGRLQIAPVFEVLAEDVNRAKQLVKEIQGLDLNELFTPPKTVAVPLVELNTVGMTVKTVYAESASSVAVLEKEIESFKKKLEDLKKAGGDQIGLGPFSKFEAAIASAERRLESLRSKQPAENLLNTTDQSLNALSFGLEKSRLEAELLVNPFDQIGVALNEIRVSGEQANLSFLSMFAQGQITVDQYRELLELQERINQKNIDLANSSQTWSHGVQQGFESIKVTAADLGNQAITGSFGAFRGFFNDITNLSGQASEAFKNFARNFAANLADMGAQVLAFQLTSGLFSNLFPGFEGFKLAQGGVVVGGLNSLPSYSDGGIAHGEQFAKIGDNPERVEAVVPLPGVGRGIPVEFKNGGGAGGVSMTNNWNIQSLDPRTAMEMIMAQRRVIEDMVANAILSGSNRDLLSAVRGA